MEAGLARALDGDGHGIADGRWCPSEKTSETTSAPTTRIHEQGLGPRAGAILLQLASFQHLPTICSGDDFLLQPVGRVAMSALASFFYFHFAFTLRLLRAQYSLLRLFELRRRSLVVVALKAKQRHFC